MKQEKIKRYRKNPDIIIEAMQLEGNKQSFELIYKWLGNNVDLTKAQDGTFIDIKTLEGVMQARIGDYIVKGILGGFYPCKPDIFETSYSDVKELEKENEELENKAQMWDELNKIVKKIEKKGMTKTIELNWILATLRTLKIHSKITFIEKYSNGKYIKHEFINNKWVDTEIEQSIQEEVENETI